MKKTQAKELLRMSDDCPECKGKMEIADECMFGDHYYYLYCPHCGYAFE